MTIKIHKIGKDLTYSNNIVPTLSSNSVGMVISHYADSVKLVEATLPYSIEVVKETVPFVDEVEFCVVIRKKVDLTAIGPNTQDINNTGKDVGANECPYQSPQRPPELPPGFTELYKG